MLFVAWPGAQAGGWSVSAGGAYWRIALLQRVLLQAGGGDAVDQVFLAGDEEADDGCDGYHGHGEHGSPHALAFGVHKGPQRQGNRVEVLVLDVEQGTEELVPGGDEREDGGGGHCRYAEGQDDAQEGPEGAAAVDLGCVVKLLRQCLHELDHQEDEEGVGGHEVGNDQREVGVQPAELRKDDVLRYQEHMAW